MCQYACRVCFELDVNNSFCRTGIFFLMEKISAPSNMTQSTTQSACIGACTHRTRTCMLSHTCTQQIHPHTHYPPPPKHTQICTHAHTHTHTHISTGACTSHTKTKVFSFRWALAYFSSRAIFPLTLQRADDGHIENHCSWPRVVGASSAGTIAPIGKLTFKTASDPTVPFVLETTDAGWWNNTEGTTTRTELNHGYLTCPGYQLITRKVNGSVAGDFT